MAKQDYKYHYSNSRAARNALEKDRKVVSDCSDSCLRRLLEEDLNTVKHLKVLYNTLGKYGYRDKSLEQARMMLWKDAKNSERELQYQLADIRRELRRRQYAINRKK